MITTLPTVRPSWPLCTRVGWNINICWFIIFINLCKGTAEVRRSRDRTLRNRSVRLIVGQRKRVQIMNSSRALSTRADSSVSIIRSSWPSRIVIAREETTLDWANRNSKYDFRFEKDRRRGKNFRRTANVSKISINVLTGPGVVWPKKRRVKYEPPDDQERERWRE